MVAGVAGSECSGGARETPHQRFTLMTNRDFRRISIERYPNPNEVGSVGLIEGEADDGTRWILWLDQAGMPSVYWPERDRETGAVIGEGIWLTRPDRTPDPAPDAAPLSDG